MAKSKKFADIKAIEAGKNFKDLWFSMSVDMRISFIEKNIRIETAKGSVIPLILTDFQKRWLLDGPLFNDYTQMTKYWNRIALKCRNVGASYVMIGVESVLSCWIYPNIFIPFVASKEDQAINLIKMCKKVVKDCRFSIPLNEDLKYQPAGTLKFKNGSHIDAFAGGNPEGIRGGRAICVVIDEMSFCKKQQEILSAVEYFCLEGGSISILSTPWGKNNLFWKIWADRENYPTWHRHLVSLFEDMKGFDVSIPLQTQISQGNFKLSAPWLNIDTLEKKRQEDAAFDYVNFMQETCGVPMEEVSTAISEEVLDTNKMEYYYVDECPMVDGRRDPKRQFVMSADFGAEANMTAVVVFEVKDGRFIVCYTEAFRGAFPDQARKMGNLVKRFAPTYLITDSTGMGGKNWETYLSEIETETTIIGVNYSKKDHAEEGGLDLSNKIFMFQLTIRLLSEGSIVVPKNFKDLREEILGVEKIVYEKTIKYSGKGGLVGSDDLAMAFCQGSLLYGKIYTIDDKETSVGATPQFSEVKQNSRKDKPVIRKTEFYEVSSGGSSLSAGKVSGFSKLI